MTPVPYTLESGKSQVDGKWYGKLSYGSTVVAEESGFKSEEGIERWARGVASSHKASISPADTHVVKKSFVL